MTDKEYTAWELAADHWWHADYVISTGHATYSDADVSWVGERVRLARLELTEDNRFKQINRYVHPNFKVRLVRRDS